MAVRAPELFRITEQDDFGAARENVNRRQDAVNATLGELLAIPFIRNGVLVTATADSAPQDITVNHGLNYKPLGFIVVNLVQPKTGAAGARIPNRYAEEDLTATPVKIVDNAEQTTFHFEQDGTYTFWIY